MQTLITVAICTRNRATLLEKAVRSVLSQAEGKHIEILIVDNGSTDSTAAWCVQIAAADHRVKIIHELKTGLSIARNTVLRQAAGEWVVFLDDDAEAKPGWLAAYENFFLHPPNPQVAVVGGAVIPQYEVAPPKWINSQRNMDAGSKSFCFPRGGGPWECNCAYRQAAVLQVGGFDPRLGHQGEVAGYREGADLNIRLQDIGYEIWWLPDAGIRHLVHASRLNLKWFLQSSFNEGRSIAIVRLKFRTGADRMFYIGARALVAPFHCGVNLLLALVSFPFQSRRVAAKALLHAASIAGFTAELLKQFFHCGSPPAVNPR